MSNENKLVKTITDSAFLIGLAAGVGYLARKVTKEPFINDPSSSITKYAKWVVVLSGSMCNDIATMRFTSGLPLMSLLS